MPSYLTLMPREPVAHTLQVNNYMLVDLSAEGRIVGVDSLQDWPLDADDLQRVLRWVKIDYHQQDGPHGS